MKTNSLWTDTADEVQFPSLSGDIEVDAAVIGAGITGVTAACCCGAPGSRWRCSTAREWRTA